jgi:trans-aconitate 2-methyltransferase
MLAEAAKAQPVIRWIQGDLRHFAPDETPDLMFSNAALHWIDGHAALFPRLVAQLTRGGVLAAQMPRNHAAPSHTAMVEAALDGPWRSRLEPLLRRAPTAAPDVYHDILAPHVSQLDIWETEYLHVLEGENPVVEWTKGSALRPLLDALEASDRSGFFNAYASRIAAAYPRRPDGRTLFPFRRLFLVATRR